MMVADIYPLSFALLKTKPRSTTHCIYQLNIFNTLIVMYKLQVRLVPDIFQDFCSVPKNNYILIFSGEYSIPLKNQN